MSTFVLSIGGSTIVPDGKINVPYLKALKALLTRRAKLGDRFLIVCGGGGTCRTYQAGLKAVGKPTRDDLDWLGIAATRFNAQFVRLMLGTLAHSELIEGDPAKFDPKGWKKPIAIAGGHKPGRSSDYSATAFAKNVGAKAVINISNVDYLYTKDPRKFDDAEMICEISWPEYRKMVGNTWTPGMNIVFDPIAAKLAQQAKLEVLLVGADIKNLAKIFAKQAFKGSVIH